MGRDCETLYFEEMKKIFLGALCLLLCLGVSAKAPVKIACVGNSITYGYTIEIGKEIRILPSYNACWVRGIPLEILENPERLC